LRLQVFAADFGDDRDGERELRQVLMRLPGDILDWLAEEAVRNCSSRNSECVRALRTCMEAQQQGVQAA